MVVGEEREGLSIVEERWACSLGENGASLVAGGEWNDSLVLGEQGREDSSMLLGEERREGSLVGEEFAPGDTAHPPAGVAPRQRLVPE